MIEMFNICYAAGQFANGDITDLIDLFCFDNDIGFRDGLAKEDVSFIGFLF